MKTKSGVLFCLLFIVSLILGACGPSGDHPITPPTALTNPEIPSILLERPLNGSIHNLGSSIYFALLLPGISSSSLHEVTFLVNGAPVGTANGSGEFNWVAPHAGEYYVQGKAVLNDGATAISTPNRICVMSLSSNSAIADEEPGYLGPCVPPTRIPNAAASGDIAISAIASPGVINYSTDPACSLTHTDIAFVATVNDPQDLVAFAAVQFETDLSGNGGFLTYLNWTTTRPVNQKEYRTTISFGPSTLAGIAGGVFRWRIVSYGRDGQALQHSALYSIPLQQIQCSQQPLEIATLTPPPSSVSCPPGTYYAEGSQQCVQIQIITPKPGSGNSGNNQCPAGQKWVCTGITHLTCSCQ